MVQSKSDRRAPKPEGDSRVAQRPQKYRVKRVEGRFVVIMTELWSTGCAALLFRRSCPRGGVLMLCVRERNGSNSYDHRMSFDG
jgi:hypothetical protein